jgi:hypothetical protein
LDTGVQFLQCGEKKIVKNRVLLLAFKNNNKKKRQHAEA